MKLSMFRERRMGRHSITANPRVQVGRAFFLLALAVAVLALASPAAEAAPQTLVLPDPDAAAENDELGRAVAFLVRASLSGGPTRVIPRRELALALEALGTKGRDKGLFASADLAPKLIERMGAEAVVVWRLDVGAKGSTVTGTMVGPGGKRLLRLGVAAATGDVAELARKVATRVAAASGGAAAEIAEVGLAELRPFLAIDAATLAGDSVAAFRAAEVASSAVAAKLAEAGNTLAILADEPSMSALPRSQARLLRSEWAAAIQLADGGLAADPNNAVLRAVKVRALVGSKDLAAAEAELVLLRESHNVSELAAATLALVLESGGSIEQRDDALAALLGRPAAEWRAVLPLIAATPPGTFGAKTEAAALAAAAKLMAQDPGLASTLAARALAGTGMARQASPLIALRELSAGQMAALSARLAAEADASSVALSKQIDRRQQEAKSLAAETGPEPPTGPPSELVRNLKTVLQGFDELYDPTLSSVQVAPFPGSGQPFYWPFLVRPYRLGEGLREALQRSPWALNATFAKVETDLLPPARLSDEGIATLAGELGAGSLLLYRVRPASLAPWATLELVLFDVPHQRFERIETAMVGRSTGLMILNPLVVALASLAGVALLAWLVVISLRGTIVVRVQWDADSKDELFSLLVSRSPTTPTIENIAIYRKKMAWLGERKRRFEAWNVQQNTTFRGIPRGKWYVHLYGVYTRGRQTMLLHEPPQEIDVLPRKTSFVAHVLEAAEAEFKILVVDDHGPVEGARVWLDDDRAKGVTTAKAGLVSLKVAKGFHVIRVSAREMTVDRPYHVVKAKVHDMTINLVWERRQEYVSRALERQVDDASEYMRKSLRRPSGSATHAATTTERDGKPLRTPPAIAGAATMLRPLTTPAPSSQAEILLASTGVELGPQGDSLPVDLPPAAEADLPLDLPAEVPAEASLDLPLDLPVDVPLDLPAVPGPATQGGRSPLSLKPLTPQSAPSAQARAPGAALPTSGKHTR
jgi:hypothetical protein